MWHAKKIKLKKIFLISGIRKNAEIKGGDGLNPLNSWNYKPESKLSLL